MQQNSQKYFVMSLYPNGLLLIEPLFTNPGLDPAIYV